MWKEFRDFSTRGSVIDLAVGVAIGTAFGKIVTSLVNDILMPPLGMVLGKVDFSDRYINLSSGDYASLAQAENAGAATINYGLFLNAVVQFLVVALVLFLLVKQMARLRLAKSQEAAPTKPCPYCFTTIPLEATRCPNCTSQLGK